MAFTDGDGDRLVLTTARSGYISSTEQAGITCLTGAPATTMIATVVTPRMVRHVAESAGMGWAETAVGFKHVVAAWRERGRPSAIGLEPNGALAYAAGSGDYFERDALRALALVIQLLPSVRAIDDAVAALRAQHPNRPEIMTSLQGAAEVLRRLSGVLRGRDLAQDGQLSSFTSGAWRVLARPSGTETVTRVYAEASPEIIQAVRTALSQPPAAPAPGD